MNFRTTRRRFIALLSSTFACTQLKPRAFAQDKSNASSERKPVAPDILIWFDQPAPEWGDALPVGNGRLPVSLILPGQTSA